RFIESRRQADYFLTIFFFVVCLFTKDNGFIVLGVMLAMVLATLTRADFKSQLRYWGSKFLPFVILTIGYFILRFALATPNRENPVYGPRLTMESVLLQVKGFLATVGNLSITSPSFMGAPGLTSLFMNNPRGVEFILCAALWLLIAYTMWRRRLA